MATVLTPLRANRRHAGIDFAGSQGSDVIAVASGVVVFADRRDGYGNLGGNPPRQQHHIALWSP